MSAGMRAHEAASDPGALARMAELLSAQEPDLFGARRVEELLVRLHAETRQGRSYYRRWERAVDGKTRRISVPSPTVRELLAYVRPLILRVPAHGLAHGAEPGWSPARSLSQHVPCRTALTFDLRDAFVHVTEEDVRGFYLTHLPVADRKEEIACVLADLCTVPYGGKRGLPQGAPHSAPLFNRILRPIDDLLAQECARRGMRCTRWVDDYTITSPEEVALADMLGSVALVERRFPVARHKVFHQRLPVYALGQVICAGGVRKNSREEMALRKPPPVADEAYVRFAPWC